MLHRDPRNFSFPDAFWLERWLVASGQLPLNDALLSLPPSAIYASGPEVSSEFVHNDLAFLAFSHGPMNCVGKGFALQEIRTVMCALVQRFSVRPRLEEGWAPREYEAGYKDFFVSTRPVLPVVLDRRTRMPV